MEDKCFCHLNGYRVKDAEARNRIETIENAGYATKNYVDDKIADIEISGEGGSHDCGYHVLNLPLGSPVVEIPFGEVTFDLPAECNEVLEEFINNVYKSEIKKPLLKVVNSSYADGVYPMPLEINYTNTSTEITHEQPTFLFFGDTMLLENMVWRSKLTVNGHWAEFQEHDTYVYTVDSCSMKLIEEASSNVDLTGYATEEYVNTAISNIEIPEGEGSNYPIYYTYISLDFGTARKAVTYSADHSSGICGTLANVLTDMVAKGYQVAEIINYAYSMNHKFTFKKPLRTSNSTAYLISTEYDYSNDIVSYATIDVSYSVTDGVYTVSQVVVTPYSKNYATRDYVTTAITQAGTPTVTTGELVCMNDTGATGTWTCYQTGNMCLVQTTCSIPANVPLSMLDSYGLNFGVIQPGFANNCETSQIQVMVAEGQSCFRVEVSNNTNAPVTRVNQLVFFTDL